MKNKRFIEGIQEALHFEMQRDERVFLIGEDISGGRGGSGQLVDAAGGVLGVTKGLALEFGEDRVLDTPISEMGYVGAAAGAAMTGMRPVVELMFNDFLGSCFDVLLNQVPKFRYMFGGKSVTPITVRAMIGAGAQAAAQHSQSLYHMLTSIAGLKVVVPSNAYDAKGLLAQAIRDDDPVIFLEHKALYELSGACADVPDEDYCIAFGEANFLREGEHITIVALGLMVHVAMEAANELAEKGITCDVIDPRTTSPLDEESILESVENTGRLVVVDESAARCSFAHDVAALVASRLFGALKAPVRLVIPPHTPIPFSPSLEQAWMPDKASVINAAMELMSKDWTAT
jgi:acetoin:2,6-dichlorophenolindophenol oxidoreductase subunit beta